MDQLCLKLQSIPGCYASIYNWNEDRYILESLDHTPPMVLIMIGFSLGAHTCTRIPTARPRRTFELIVGFDPSRLAKLEPVPSNVQRAICFYNPDAWIFGGRKYTGHNVENHQIGDPHLLVDWDSNLWNSAIAAVNDTIRRSAGTS